MYPLALHISPCDGSEFYQIFLRVSTIIKDTLRIHDCPHGSPT